jgi:TRAP-type mannitol/chloroaromatic compound transport system substrate-binding protein
MTARQMNAWMCDGSGLPLLRDFFARYRIVNFPCGNTTAQMGGWYRKEIRSVEDLQGLKFRVGGFGGRVLAKLGVVPQNLPGGEVYQALEKGTIDATEFVGPYDDLQLGVHRVAPYYYYPAWWEGGAQISIYINADQWRSLSPTYQAIVTNAAAAAHVQCQARYDARNPQALKQLVAEGAKLLRFPKEVMDAAFRASREVYAELEASNPNWKKIYPDYSRFLAEQVQWESVAEANYFQYLAARLSTG